MLTDKPSTMRRFLEAANAEARQSNEPNRFYEDLCEEVQDNASRPKDQALSRVSIAGLFEELVPDGREALQLMDSRRRSSQPGILQEGPNAIQTTDFSNITGQLTYAAVLNAWNAPEFIGEQLVTTKPTDVLGPEIIPGIGGLGDMASEFGAISEGESYPLAGVSEQYVTAPRKNKRGFIVPITREALIADRTGQLVQQASGVAHSMRVNKEKRILDMVLGQTTSYSRNGSAAVATYNNTGAEPHAFDNLIGGALTDWNDINVAEQSFNEVTDPTTGEPIIVGNRMLLVPQLLHATARNILNTTEVRETNGNTVTINGNPIDSGITLLTSPYVKLRNGSSDVIWHFGDFLKAFSYMEIWPITVEQSPSNNEWSYTNDIVSSFKVTEMGGAAVEEPRYCLKSTGS